MSTDEHLVANAANRTGWRHIGLSSMSGKKQAMEMTEYGSMESHDAGFPPFPHSLEIPSGFPHSHGLDDWLYVFLCPSNSHYSHRKGLVTDVSGPQRNACPGTPPPLAAFAVVLVLRGGALRGGWTAPLRFSLALQAFSFLFRGVRRGTSFFEKKRNGINKSRRTDNPSQRPSLAEGGRGVGREYG